MCSFTLLAQTSNRVASAVHHKVRCVKLSQFSSKNPRLNPAAFDCCFFVLGILLCYKKTLLIRNVQEEKQIKLTMIFRQYTKRIPICSLTTTVRKCPFKHYKHAYRRTFNLCLCH